MMKRLLPLAAAAAGLLALALPAASQAAVPYDSLVKASGDAVYYHAADGRRYAFPSQRVYETWFSDFSQVQQITDEDLASMMLGGNVTYRPGIRMVKITTDPKVYAVAKGGVLRWMKTETVAEQLYGTNWNEQIDDLPDAYFFNYTIGAPIETALDFRPASEVESAPTINADRGLPSGSAPLTSNTAWQNDYATWGDFAFDNINEIRAEHGRPPLVRNAHLDQIAFYHSKDMARNIGEMSHDGSNGESSPDRIKRGEVPNFDGPGLTNIPYPDNIGWSGENVGMRDIDWLKTAEAAIVSQHNWFLDEPDNEYNHRTTMLSTMAPFTEVGIGLYLDEENRLWITEDYISH